MPWMRTPSPVLPEIVFPAPVVGVGDTVQGVRRAATAARRAVQVEGALAVPQRLAVVAEIGVDPANGVLGVGDRRPAPERAAQPQCLDRVRQCLGPPVLLIHQQGHAVLDLADAGLVAEPGEHLKGLRQVRVGMRHLPHPQVGVAKLVVDVAEAARVREPPRRLQGDAQLASGRTAAAKTSWEDALDLLGRLPAKDVRPVRGRLDRLAAREEAASA